MMRSEHGSRVNVLDHFRVLFGNAAAAHLHGGRHFAIVVIELNEIERSQIAQRGLGLPR